MNNNNQNFLDLDKIEDISKEDNNQDKYNKNLYFEG
jgi:hypothetical protein